MSNGRLEGKAALVVGGAGGMGACESRRFVEEGASVVIADILDEIGHELVAELGDQANYVHLNVTNADEWGSVVSRVVDLYGSLDIMVNNAGLFHVASILDTSVDDFRAMNEVNIIGTFLGLQAAGSVMTQASTGSIVNIASTGGLTGATNRGAYVATKHAVVGLTRTAAQEFGPANVRVNAVCPGGTETKMIADLLPSSGDSRKMFRKVPLGRIGQPEEIADLVLFLGSDESSYCSGSMFVIDGGLMAGLQV